MKQHSKRRPLVIGALVATLGLVFVPLAASAADLIDSADIKNDSVKAVDLAPNSVGKSETGRDSVGTDEVAYNSLIGWDIENGTLTGVDIKDKSIGLQEFSASAVAALAGNDGADGADGVVEPVYGTFTSNVTNIGGPFLERATKAGEITLTAGKYMITTDALFRSNQVTSGNTTLQVAVRAADGTQWGQDLGTAFTGDSPEAANRETSASTTRVVTLTEDETVSVYVFGYESNGSGSADSGKFDAEVYLTAVPVQ